MGIKIAKIAIDIAKGIKKYRVITNIHEIKYKPWIEEDNKIIEDAILSHFYKFRRFPNVLRNNTPKELLDKIKARWDEFVEPSSQRKERTLIVTKPKVCVEEIDSTIK